MADIYSKAKRSEVMSRIRSKDTGPEKLIRSALHRKGFRFRLHDLNLPGKPDIVLPRYKVAVQVRGCFWHGHRCGDGHTPKSRRGYWVPKLAMNKVRDARNDRRLRRMGWRVIVVWECRCMKAGSLAREVHRIQRLIEARSAQSS